MSSDDYLDDFIVDDSPISQEEKELNLADGEDDESENSDLSFPDLSSRPPTVRKLFPKPSSKFVTPGEVDSDDDSGDEPVFDTLEHHVPTALGSLTPVKQEEPKLPELLAGSSNSAAGTKMIDLTLSSDDNFIDLITPKKKTPTLKLINRNISANRSSPINLISDSDDANHVPDLANFPALEDTAAIAKYSHQDWIRIADRERLLISVLHVLRVKTRNAVFALTYDNQEEIWHNIVEVIRSIRKDKEGVKGMDDATFEVTLLTLCNNEDC